MTSEIQIATNRENARKSTGPRTPEGRAIVARNGVTHGLTGRFQLLDGESPTILDDLLARLTAEHRPGGETESFLVRQLAELQLRLDRASSLESELMRAVVDPQSPASTPNAILARTLLKDCTFDVALLRLNRYEGSLRRSHLAALRELRQQQKARRDQAPLVNQPSVAEVMKKQALEIAKTPDKANPVPTPATAPAVEIHPSSDQKSAAAGSQPVPMSLGGSRIEMKTAVSLVVAVSGRGRRGSEEVEVDSLSDPEHDLKE